jgi:hypothetical protein
MEQRQMMKVIRPNCRVQLTAEDLEFILSVLRPKVGTADCLVKLLADEESRDLILDDEALFRAVLEHRNCLRISTHFYFYILVRQVFRRSGLTERNVADYVAEVLAEFSRAESTRCMVKGQAKPLDYFVDMLAALQIADDTTSFYIRAHIGNHSLFLAGIFPDRIRWRAERRGAPDLKYYEEVGRSSYRAARDHRLAYKYDLADIFNTLSERFQHTRLALNDLGERLVTLGEVDNSIDALLKSSMKLGL